VIEHCFLSGYSAQVHYSVPPLREREHLLLKYSSSQTASTETEKMEMESCTSWIGGACFSLAERNWRERSRRSQTWYRCANMAVIQRSNVIKQQRSENSKLNEHALDDVPITAAAGNLWNNYSYREMLSCAFSLSLFSLLNTLPSYLSL